VSELVTWIASVAAIVTAIAGIWGAIKTGLIDVAEGGAWVRRFFAYRLKPRLTIAVKEAWWNPAQQNDGSWGVQLVIDCLISNSYPHGVIVIRPEVRIPKLGRRSTLGAGSYEQLVEPRNAQPERFVFSVS
jgi:hypothetical protein